MKVKVVHNRWPWWTWLVLDDKGFVLDYGIKMGKKRAARKAERFIEKGCEPLEYVYPAVNQ